MRDAVRAVFERKFPAEVVAKFLGHYDAVVTSYVHADWDRVLTEAGKFVEATLRCLRWSTTGDLLDGVEVGAEIDRLQQLPKSTADEPTRLLIPRVLRGLYQISCNRGARHDRLGFDPNKMDATLAVANVSWVLAEMIRIGHRGSLTPEEAQRLASEIAELKSPAIENIDGLTFFHREKVSARDMILVKLRTSHSARIPRKDILDTLHANGFTIANARTTLANLRHEKLVYESVEGVRLLAPGMHEADAILSGKATRN